MDVLTALGIEAPNVSAKLTEKGIPTDERKVVTKTQVTYRNPVALGFPARGMTFINTTAVRRIAQRSTKPAAREFQNFLNGTVAEAIEKDGAYLHPAMEQPLTELHMTNVKDGAMIL